MPIPDAPSERGTGSFYGFPLSESEQEEVWELNRMIIGARTEVAKFRSAIALADLVFRAREQIMPGLLTYSVEWYWPYFAAFAAIDTVFQFHEHLIAIEDWMATASAAKYVPKANVIEEIKPILQKKMPQWESLRHAVAHSGEIRRKPGENAHRAKLSRSPIKKAKGVPMLLQWDLEGRTIKTTRRGELLRFEVTWDAYLRFNSVYEDFLARLIPPERPSGRV